MVDVGFDLMSSMTTGNVDATIGCLVNHEVPQLEKEGFEVNYFFPDDFGVPKYYEGIFLASDEMIDNEPDVLAGLSDAHAARASRTSRTARMRFCRFCSTIRMRRTLRWTRM